MKKMYFEIVVKSDVDVISSLDKELSRFYNDCKSLGINVQTAYSGNFEKLSKYNLKVPLSDYLDVFDETSETISDLSSNVVNTIINNFGKSIFIYTEPVGDVFKGLADRQLSSLDKGLYGVKIIIPEIKDYAELVDNQIIFDALKTSNFIDEFDIKSVVADIAENHLNQIGSSVSVSKSDLYNDFVRNSARSVIIPSVLAASITSYLVSDFDALSFKSLFYFSCASILAASATIHIYCKKTKHTDVSLSEEINDAEFKKLFEAKYLRDDYTDSSLKDWLVESAYGLGDFTKDMLNFAIHFVPGVSKIDVNK